MRRFARLAALLVGALIAPLAAYLLAALICALAPGPVAPVSALGAPVRIGLVSGPIHTDFLLPLTAETRARFAFAATAGGPLDHPDAQWLVVGWGAQGFYTTTGTYGDVALSSVWRAATGDSAVLRLDVLGHWTGGNETLWLDLPQSRYEALLTGMLSEFTTREALPLPGFTDTDAFYPARGWFQLFNTCNNWIALRLRAAGQPFGYWTPIPQSIALSMSRFANPR